MSKYFNVFMDSVFMEISVILILEFYMIVLFKYDENGFIKGLLGKLLLVVEVQGELVYFKLYMMLYLILFIVF